MSSMVSWELSGAAPGSTECSGLAPAKGLATSRSSAPPGHHLRPGRPDVPMVRTARTPRRATHALPARKPLPASALEPPERRATGGSGAFRAKNGLRSRAHKRSPLLDNPKRRASCWALLKRCTSSRNRIVPRPSHRVRSGLGRARSDVLHSGIDWPRGSAGTGEPCAPRAGAPPSSARAGRTEDTRRAQPVILKRARRRGTRTEKMALADDFVQPGGA